MRKEEIVKLAQIYEGAVKSPVTIAEDKTAIVTLITYHHRYSQRTVWEERS